MGPLSGSLYAAWLADAVTSAMELYISIKGVPVGGVLEFEVIEMDDSEDKIGVMFTEPLPDEFDMFSAFAAAYGMQRQASMFGKVVARGRLQLIGVSIRASDVMTTSESDGVPPSWAPWFDDAIMGVPVPRRANPKMAGPRDAQGGWPQERHDVPSPDPVGTGSGAHHKGYPAN